MNKNYDVCIMGLGYIGLPMAAVLANKGKKVLGVDVKSEVVDLVNSGDTHIIEPNLEDYVIKAVVDKKLIASMEPDVADVFIVAVPTPFHKDKLNKITNSPKPNIDFIVAAIKKIAPYLRKGNLILLESTSPVGTTGTIVEMLNEQKINTKEIYIAYSPERVFPGKIIRELIENNRVVGGINIESTKKASEFYRSFVKGMVLETDAMTAEMTKLTENAFRDVNIAFANELSIICERLKIDVWELIKLSNNHPRVDVLNPGPGVGGHCIAVDPWFIIDSAPQESRLIYCARRINDDKPMHILNKVKLAAKHFKQPVIACLGLAFKADIGDLRESPSLRISEEIAKQKKWEVLAVEPNISVLPDTLLSANCSLVGLEDAITRADIVVVLVDHKEFKEVMVRELNIDGVIIDTRGIWKDEKNI